MKSITQQRIDSIFNGNPVTRQDRLYLLSLRGITQYEIARQLGVTSVTVHQVLADKRKSYNVASKIAEITGVPLNKLWPDGRYDYQPNSRRKAA